MIDCSKTENYLAEKLRMTKKTKNGICKTKCSDCPLYSKNNGTSEGLSCGCLEIYYPEKAVKAVQEWSDEHPPKTYLTEFLKNYPNAKLDEDGTPKNVCPYYLGLISKNNCRINRINRNCVECWNQPIEGGEK